MLIKADFEAMYKETFQEAFSFIRRFYGVGTNGPAAEGEEWDKVAVAMSETKGMNGNPLLVSLIVAIISELVRCHHEWLAKAEKPMPFDEYNKQYTLVYKYFMKVSLYQSGCDDINGEIKSELGEEAKRIMKLSPFAHGVMSSVIEELESNNGTAKAS